MINPIKPARLHVGDTVALISPASRVADKKDVVRRIKLAIAKNLKWLYSSH